MPGTQQSPCPGEASHDLRAGPAACYTMLCHAKFTFHGLSEIKITEPRPFLCYLLSMQVIQNPRVRANCVDKAGSDPGSEREIKGNFRNHTSNREGVVGSLGFALALPSTQLSPMLVSSLITRSALRLPQHRHRSQSFLLSQNDNQVTALDLTRLSLQRMSKTMPPLRHGLAPVARAPARHHICMTGSKSLQSAQHAQQALFGGRRRHEASERTPLGFASILQESP